MAMSINDILAAFSGIQEDTMAEFAEAAPSKEQLQMESKKVTNLKWGLIDGAISIGTAFLNQKRQKEFQHLEETSAKDAEVILKNRQARLETLKSNLGVTAIEQKLENQDKVLNEIKSILGQLQSAADKMKQEKSKVKDLHPAKISKKEVEDYEEFT